MLNDSLTSPPQKQRSFIYRFLFILILLLAGVFGVLQTQLFISLSGRPSLDEIQRQMAASDNRQREIAARHQQQTGEAPGENIDIKKDFFSQIQYKAIAEATKSLVSDDDTLPYFRTSLEGVRAVIFPAWMIEKPEDFKAFGITAAGARDAPAVAGHPQIAAFTLRDRADRPDEITVDGRPRIAINLSAFKSKETLRLTIFHELLHAGNVPGYDPSNYTVLQNDLTYLPEYRGYIAREGLEGWRELRLWGWWVIAPWGVGMLLILFTPWRRSRTFGRAGELYGGAAGRVRGWLGMRQGVAPLPGQVAPVSPDDPGVSGKQDDGGD